MKVLIVEDNKTWMEVYKGALEGKVEVVEAFSISEALKKFEINPDLSIIVMDACVPGVKINTESLVEYFRKTFSGPMIASFTVPEFGLRLIQAGCSRKCDKIYVPQMILETLSLI